MIKKIRVLILLLVSLMSSVLTVDIARSDNGQPQSAYRDSQEDQLKARRARMLAIIQQRRKKLMEQAKQERARFRESAQQRVAEAQKRSREAQQQRSVRPLTNRPQNAGIPPAAVPAVRGDVNRGLAQQSGNNSAVTNPQRPSYAQSKRPPNSDGGNTTTQFNRETRTSQSYHPQPPAVQPPPVQPLPIQSYPGNRAYQEQRNNLLQATPQPKVVGTHPKEILLLKILKGDGVTISIQEAQNLADAVLDYGGIDSVRSGIFGTIPDVREADKEYGQIRDMFTEFLLEASRKRCTEAVKLFEGILKKLQKTMLHGMCADFISLTNFLHDHLLSEKIIKYRNKFLKKLNRLRMLDERIFIKGLITKVTEDDVGCLTAELSGLIIHEARNALLSKSQKSEASKLAALRIIKKEISIFITAFAIGHYKLAKASLRRIRATAKVHGIEEFGNKFLSHVMSFPAVNLILKNIK